MALFGRWLYNKIIKIVDLKQPKFSRQDVM